MENIIDMWSRGQKYILQILFVTKEANKNPGFR